MKSGVKGTPTTTPTFHPELLDPKPSTVYRVDDRHLFVTDAHGRVVNVRSRLMYVPTRAARSKRSAASQRRAGGAQRRFKGGLRHRLRRERWAMGDDGGHWIAATLGGPGESLNIAAMVKRINGNRRRNLHPPGQAWRGRLAGYEENYFRQEARWRKLLQRDPPARIVLDIHVTYPKARLDDPGAVSHRPKSFTVYSTIDGGEQKPMRFRNDTW